MDWLRRVGHPPPTGQEPDPVVSEAVEAAAPGVAALLEGVAEDGRHAVLDLGAASPYSLDFYSRFARRIRFADLLGHAVSAWGLGSVADLLASVPPAPERPYDLVFAWDILDRLLPEYHAPLMARLDAVTARDVRLHVVVRGSAETGVKPLRFALLDIDRMRYEPTGPVRSALPRHLPAQLAHLLEPFRVTRGFTLKGDLREYVAFGKGDPPPYYPR
jgi:hypothetical protein